MPRKKPYANPSIKPLLYSKLIEWCSAHQVPDLPSFSAPNLIELLIINFLATASPDDEVIKAFKTNSAEIQESIAVAIAKIRDNIK